MEGEGHSVENLIRKDKEGREAGMTLLQYWFWENKCPAPHFQSDGKT